MKTIKEQSKQLAFVFMLLMLIQSCVAYGPPIALEEAAKKTQKTRVKYENGEIYRFLYLVQEDGDYYGVVRENGKMTNAQIDFNRIENVRAYHKSRSTIATILTPILLTGVIIGITAATWTGPSLNWGN